MSTTDPDASVTRRGKGRSKLEYQVHRGVDSKCEIITATEATPGEVHEAHRLQALIDGHEKNTGAKVEAAVADSKYGTLDNYVTCHDRKIKAHIPSLEQTQNGYKRARWRRLWRVEIQEYLTAGIRNMMVLLQHIKEPAPALGRVQPKPRYQKTYFSLKELFFYFKEVVTRVINQFFTLKCYQGII